jgi:hypothetical protein
VTDGSKANRQYIENVLLQQGIYCRSVTLREERRLRVFGNRGLGGIFRARSDGVTGELVKLHNEELNDLYCSPTIVRVIKSRIMIWAEHVAPMCEWRVEGKRPLGRRSCRL